ncbi:MAG: NHLP bacteriocin export ABC transporter permease/ATPase subunit [Planctomycetia bacterium]
MSDERTPLQSVIEAFEKVGIQRDVAGNHPLILADTQNVWLVKSGSVDVFTVPMLNNEPAGGRCHLCTVVKGGLLFGGHDPDELQLSLPDARVSSTCLLGTGIPGTQVLELSPLQFAEIAKAEANAPALALLVDQWLQGLMTGIRPTSIPKTVNWLEANQTIELQHGSAISSSRCALWISADTGALQLPGKGDILPQQNVPAPSASGRLFPVIDPGWLEVSENIAITPLATAQILGTDPFRNSLAAFHSDIIGRAAANVRTLTAAELARMKRKSACEQQVLKTSLSMMASIAQPDRIVDPFLIATDDPLLAACQLVGQRIGIRIQPPHDFRHQAGIDPVSGLARSSGVRVRRVLLSDRWWQDDNGPLLAFRTTDGTPVALLPRSSTEYLQVDPSTGDERPVTAETASSLQPFGYCFYRPFPATALHPQRVFGFGLPGTSRDWIAAAVLGLAGGMLSMLVPMATGAIFGRIIPGFERTQLWLIVLGLTVSSIAIAIFEFTQGIAIQRVQVRMGTSVEAAIWDRLLSLPASFFRNYTAGDLAMRSMGISAIRQTLTDAAMSSVVSFAFSIVSFALLFYYEARLAMVAVGIFLIVVSVTSYAAYRQLKYQRAYYEQNGKTAGIVLQLLTGISRLRVAGAENRALAYWARHYSRQTKLSYRASSVANNLASFSDAMPVLATFTIFGAVTLLPTATISVGSFLAFNAACTQIIFSAVMLSSAVTSLLAVIPLYERAKPILDAVPEHHLARRQSFTLGGEIEINHVSFRYHADGPLVLEDISIHIRPGEFVAFVGPSGSGKSTILRLLLGFESPTTGSIYYDHEDLSGLDLQSVRRQMGVILQNSQLTPGDILSNVTRSFQYTQDDAWEAARMTGLDQDLAEMPMGMYTVISDGETTLSGGQRQRLLITQAIVSKPNIILFDEATSALDNVSQAKVAESLQKLKATRIAVAHRLSTIINADRICVIDHGQLVQEGRYDDLISRPGPFAELAKRQLLLSVDSANGSV